MRVTDRMLHEANQAGLARSRERHAQALEDNATGERVHHPWDDPAAASLGKGYGLDSTRHEAISQAVGRASDELAAADGALAEVEGVLQRASELAVQLSNDTYSANDRAAGASEVAALLQSTLATLNAKVGNRYVFGGYRDQTAPFDAAGNYLGDAGVRKVEIAPGVYQDASLRADVALKGVGGGVDVLATLSSLSTALAANDTAGLRGSLDGLATGLSQVSLARSQGGSYANVLEAAGQIQRTARDAAVAARAREVDADPFEAATRLAFAERALEAALAATAKSFKPSLLDKL